MKVCTVLGSATSKRPIKLLSHADRQKSGGEGRAGKRPRTAPGSAAAGGRGTEAPTAQGKGPAPAAGARGEAVSSRRSPVQGLWSSCALAQVTRGSPVLRSSPVAGCSCRRRVLRAPASAKQTGRGHGRGKKGTIYRLSLLVKPTSCAGTGRHGSKDHSSSSPRAAPARSSSPIPLPGSIPGDGAPRPGSAPQGRASNPSLPCDLASAGSRAFPGQTGTRSCRSSSLRSLRTESTQSAFPPGLGCFVPQRVPGNKG